MTFLFSNKDTDSWKDMAAVPLWQLCQTFPHSYINMYTILHAWMSQNHRLHFIAQTSWQLACSNVSPSLIFTPWASSFLIFHFFVPTLQNKPVWSGVFGRPWQQQQQQRVCVHVAVLHASRTHGEYDSLPYGPPAAVSHSKSTWSLYKSVHPARSNVPLGSLPVLLISLLRTSPCPSGWSTSTLCWWAASNHSPPMCK